MKIKEKHLIFVSKKFCGEKHVDLSLIEEKCKIHYLLIKHFQTMRYDHTLHRRRNHFCHYYLQLFSMKKYENFILKTALKLMENKRL